MSAISFTFICSPKMIANASDVSTSSTTPNPSSTRTCLTAPPVSWAMGA